MCGIENGIIPISSVSIKPRRGHVVWQHKHRGLLHGVILNLDSGISMQNRPS